MKTISVLSLVIVVTLMAGCSIVYVTNVEKQEENTVDNMIVESEESEVIYEHVGEDPQTTLELHYEETIKLHGPPNLETWSIYDKNGEPSLEHAYYLASQLQMDYEQVAYIQTNEGIEGLERFLKTVDQTVPGAADTLREFEDYHAVTSFDMDFIMQEMTADLTAQEQAEFIINMVAEEYETFYGSQTNLAISQQGLVTTISELSGFDANKLSTIIASGGELSKLIEILPDDLSYKSTLLNLVK
ncbi:MAG: hypothetical protein Q8P90_02925 [bacterium]|nr:hypothetical protein [bacterium]